MPKKRRRAQGFASGSIAKAKKIGGKVFIEYLSSRTKTQAEADAKTMRKRGYNARIVKRNTKVARYPDYRIINYPEHVVWVRKRRKK